MVNWHWRTWADLDKAELYDLLRLRNEVFIVEQGDPYPDLDGWDDKAEHLLGYDDDKLVAYARLFLPGVKRDEAVLGRICTAATHRRLGLGDVMIEKRLEFLKQRAPGCDVYTSLQAYRQPKYESLGFTAMGEPYIDGKIVHIDMILRTAA